MVEKAGQAVKIVKTVFPLFRTGLHCFSILRYGKNFLEGHSSKYRLRKYAKRQEKQQRKIQKQCKSCERRKKLSLVLNQERFLLKTALILRKRYF